MRTNVMIKVRINFWLLKSIGFRHWLWVSGRKCLRVPTRILWNPLSTVLEGMYYVSTSAWSHDRHDLGKFQIQNISNLILSFIELLSPQNIFGLSILCIAKKCAISILHVLSVYCCFISFNLSWINIHFFSFAHFFLRTYSVMPLYSYLSSLGVFSIFTQRYCFSNTFSSYILPVLVSISFRALAPFKRFFFHISWYWFLYQSCRFYRRNF